MIVPVEYYSVYCLLDCSNAIVINRNLHSIQYHVLLQVSENISYLPRALSCSPWMSLDSSSLSFDDDDGCCSLSLAVVQKSGLQR